MNRKLLLEIATEFTPPEKRPKTGTVAFARLVEADGCSVLNINIYHDDTCRARYFLSKDNNWYSVWMGGTWHPWILSTAIMVCAGERSTDPYARYDYERGSFLATKEDEDVVADYFADQYAHPSYAAIAAYEYTINRGRRLRAYERKCERINNAMALVDPVPDEVRAWLQETIFPGDWLFFARGSRTAYSCTACGAHGWRKKPWKNYESTMCPKCSRRVTVCSSLATKKKEAAVVFMQPYGNGYIVRQFKSACTWTDGKKEINLYEGIREIHNNDGHTKRYYGTMSEADEFEQEWWDTNPAGKRELKSYLYPGNLDEVLPIGNLQRCGLKEMAAYGGKFCVWNYMWYVNRCPELEYLAKAGLYRIAGDPSRAYFSGSIINGAGNLKTLLQIDGNRLARLKRMNGGICALLWLQYEQQCCDAGNKIKIAQDTLEYLDTADVNPKDCGEILDAMKSVNRMANYLRKQRCRSHRVLEIWRDYLRMAAEEGMDITDDIVRFPKDLKARHDGLVEIRNARRDRKRFEEQKTKYEALDEKIKVRTDQAAIYYWQDDNYMIVPAASCEQLVKEGRALHHCVGASDLYMRAMADGYSWILFLRKKNTPDKPYYTLEIDVQNDKILQWYSEYDRKPDEKEIAAVLKKYKRTLQQRRRTTRIRIPVACTA